MLYVAMTLTSKLFDDPFPVRWPNGCEGVLLVWKSKKAARAWYGKDVQLVQIQTVPQAKKGD